MTVDLRSIEYLQALEQKLTAMLHLTTGTPARPVLLRLLKQDLRPTIEQCHCALDQMAQTLCERENGGWREEVGPLAECCNYQI